MLGKVLLYTLSHTFIIHMTSCRSFQTACMRVQLESWMVAVVVVEYSEAKDFCRKSTKNCRYPYMDIWALVITPIWISELIFCKLEA